MSWTTAGLCCNPIVQTSSYLRQWQAHLQYKINNASYLYEFISSVKYLVRSTGQIFMDIHLKYNEVCWSVEKLLNPRERGKLWRWNEGCQYWIRIKLHDYRECHYSLEQIVHPPKLRTAGCYPCIRNDVGMHCFKN